MRRIGAVVVPLLVLVACAGTGGGDDDTTSVIAGFYPLYEAASRIGGDDVVVSNLTPPGVEPHDIELTTRDLDVVIEADVVLYLEGAQPSLQAALSRSDADAIDLMAVAGDATDPHIWLDPHLMVDVARAITDALAAAAPQHADAFAGRAEVYVADLADLDATFERGLAACERHTIVTTHAAFGHLADRYGLTQHAVAGLAPEGEPDPARLAELADLVSDEGVTTVFTEPLASDRVARTLARESDAEIAELHPIESLTTEEADAGDDYASIMRANLTALRDALGCDA